MFVNEDSGTLVDISGSDSRRGSWTHKAFIPARLPQEMPALSPRTFLAVSEARAALAALDSTARQLPNPQLLRNPSLRREAQSTSALEGTYAPLQEVMTAAEDDASTAELREVLNYLHMATLGFSWTTDGRPVTKALLAELQGVLMRGTPLEPVSGRLRDTQVVIGKLATAPADAFPIHAARFVPCPPGDQLESGVEDLIAWLQRDHRGAIDPVVSAAMAHYQFETLHPFRDGNGRLGRYLIVLHLLSTAVLSEPTLTVSPWFEARRTPYYDALLGVSTRGAWDPFVTFFAQGLEEAASKTRTQMLQLVAIQAELKQVIRQSSLRSSKAELLVDLAVANPSFTTRQVQQELDISHPRAGTLIRQLIDLKILEPLNDAAYNRRFFAPAVLDLLLATDA